MRSINTFHVVESFFLSLHCAHSLGLTNRLNDIFLNLINFSLRVKISWNRSLNFISTIWSVCVCVVCERPKWNESTKKRLVFLFVPLNMCAINGLQCMHIISFCLISLVAVSRLRKFPQCEKRKEIKNRITMTHINRQTTC